MEEILRGGLLVLPGDFLQIGAGPDDPFQEIRIDRIDLFLELLHKRFVVLS